jgi:hypothetical protein
LNWHASVIADLGHYVAELVVVPRAAFLFDARGDIFVDRVGSGACAHCIGSGASGFDNTVVEAVDRAGGEVIDCLGDDKGRERGEDDRVLHAVLMVYS